MEASVAGQAAAGDAGQQGEAQEGQQGAPDVGQLAGQLADQLGQLSAGQEELRQFLQTQPWQPQEGQEQQQQQDESFDLSFLDPADAAFDPEAAAERLGTLIESTASSRAEQLIQQHVAPLAEQQAEMRREAEIERLVGEFPEIGDPEVGPQVVSAARQIAEAAGHTELANEPWLWRLTFMAGRAAEAASQEGGEDPRAAHLEGGAGARPGGSQEVDLGEQIVAARRGRSVLPFG